MTTGTTAQKALRRRLAPLYAAVFLQGFVLWYATEKLFMTTIGFNATTIGAMVALYSVVIIFTETPFGILADRWSRKYVLVMAGLALALSGLISGLSTNVPMFLVGTSFWGVFFALYSGTYDSIIYDTLIEETGSTQNYEKHLGRTKFLDGSALVLGALLGGLIAQFVGFRETYFFTIPIALLSVTVLTVFREPQLHKSAVALPIRQHVGQTLHAVLRQRYLVPVLMVLITTAVVSYIILEFSQVWQIALAAPLFLYGPIDAVILAGYGLGGSAGGRLRFERPMTIASLLVILAASIGLAVIHNLAVIVICLTLTVAALTALNVVFTTRLHDALASHIRVGAASAVSTLGRMVIVPVSVGFGYFAQRAGVFQASWLLVAIVMVTCFFALRALEARR